MTKNSYPKVLTIAGSDSGGGAGIQADIKAISANGCYAASVITAVTAQNTLGVHAIHPLPVDFICAQLDAVLTDIGADAIKVGMLFSAAIVEAVADRLACCGVDTVVVDPVMVATSGASLLDRDAVETLKARLLPLATVITPNLPEAEVLLGRKISGDLSAAEEAAAELRRCGTRAVLITGGHGDGDDAVDILAEDDGRIQRFGSPRTATVNTHGTGCTLSSAIAAGLAKGLSPADAVAAAKAYLAGAVAAGADLRIGGGHGPVDHFFLQRGAQGADLLSACRQSQKNC